MNRSPLRSNAAGQPRRAPALGCGRSAGAAAVWRRAISSRSSVRARSWPRRRLAAVSGSSVPAAAVKYSSAIFLIATIAILLQVIFNLEAIRYTALHRRADLRRHHAAQAGAEVLGGLLHRDRILSARLAGARRQRRGDAARRVDGAHAGRARSGGAGVGRDRAHPLRRARSSRSAAPSSACSSTSPGRCSPSCSCSCSPSTSRSCRCRTGGRRSLGFFSFTGLPQPIDWGLIGALAATAGSGGLGNLTVTNWIRDKGFGMGAKVGAIPSAVGGHAFSSRTSARSFRRRRRI